MKESSESQALELAQKLHYQLTTYLENLDWWHKANNGADQPFLLLLLKVLAKTKQYINVPVKMLAFGATDRFKFEFTESLQELLRFTSQIQKDSTEGLFYGLPVGEAQRIRSMVLETYSYFQALSSSTSSSSKSTGDFGEEYESKAPTLSVLTSDENVAEQASNPIFSATSQPPPVVTTATTQPPETTGVNAAVDTGCWLLKLNANEWEIPARSVGETAWFHTHDQGRKPRPEYGLFFNMRKGDKVLGYAYGSHEAIGSNRVVGSYEAVALLFVVTEAVHNDVRLGECIKLVITQKFNPPIPLVAFRNHLPTAIDLQAASPVKLYSLTQDQYRAILEAGHVAPAKSGRKDYLPFYATEGNHQMTEDQLEFEHDIDSFASVISLKSVQPPLAIGLFGKWGSGKSFFMEKLRDRIDQFTHDLHEDYVKNVVQVKFNSWHYSDANLWASMITEIFDALNAFAKKEDKEDQIQKLSDALQLTNMQKEVAEARRKELESNVESLKARQAEQRARLEHLSGFELIKRALSDPNIEEDIRGLKNEHIEKIINDKAALTAYLDKLDSYKNNYGRLLKNLKGPRWWIVIGIAAIVFAVVYLIHKEYRAEWSQVSAWVSGLFASGVSLVTGAWRLVAPVRAKLDFVSKRLESLRSTMTDHPEAPDPALEKSKMELQGLTDSLRVIDQKIEETRKEIIEIQSGKKLLAFIEQRARDESYARQLGLISWIRKDFQRLDELLRQQHAAHKAHSEGQPKPEIALQIDRIVLYIDDLDRCKEDIVVKVLEAVHLLLALPLFVVVVGVDPRWLNNALNVKYNSLFGATPTNGPRKEGDAAQETILAGAATSYDYLEKIFQIPFSLKPINQTGRENLISYLLREELEPAKPSTLREPPLDPIGAPKRKDGFDDEDEPEQQVDVPKPPDEQNRTKLKSELPPPIKRDKLTFTKEEIAFLQKLSPLFGLTPRTINRYVNIYRIIKSHRKLDVRDTFSHDEFIPIMLVLAIVVGDSDFAQPLISSLTAAADQITLGVFLQEPPGGVNARIMACLDDKTLSMPLADFKRNLPLIARFSFRTLTY